MSIRLLTLVGLLLPFAASAQGVRAPTTPVTLELVSTADVDALASKLTVAVSYTVHGKTEAEAERAKTAKLAEVLRLLQGQGIAASAVTEASEADSAKATLSTADTMITDTAEASDSAEALEPDYTATNARTVEVASLTQAKAVKTALEAIDVSVAEPVAELNDADTRSARRTAKAKALREAREDAEAYAREMNLRVGRIARISESGNGLFLPGIQDTFEEAMAKGPSAMMGLFQNKPGTIRVRASIIVEFVLAP